MMSLTSIIQKLEHLNPKILHCFDLNVSICGIKFWDDTDQGVAPDKLVLCNAQKCKMVLSAANPLNIICIGKIENIELDLTNKKHQLIVLETFETMEMVYNKISDFLESDRYLAQITNKLMRDFSSGQIDSVQKIVSEAYVHFHNLIAVIDKSLSILAYSTENLESGDESWITFVKRGQPSMDDVSQARLQHLFEQIEKTKNLTFVSKGKYFSFNQIIAPILVDNKVSAFLIINGALKDIEEIDYSIANIFCGFLSMQLQKEKLYYRAKDKAYEYFLEDLLKGAITKDIDVQEKLKFLEWNIKEYTYVITFDTSMQVSEKLSIEYYRNYIRSIVHNGKAILYNDDIVVIVTSSQNKPFSNAEETRLHSFMKKNNIFAGISRACDNIRNISKYYIQSKIAAKAARTIHREKVIVNYDNVTMLHILNMLPQDFDYTDVCHPALLKVLQYDELRRTNYLETLYYYLTLERNVTVLSNFLHIHRSTAIYRIERIEKLLGQSLEDSVLRFNLLLSFQLMKYSTKYNFLEIE